MQRQTCKFYHAACCLAGAVAASKLWKRADVKGGLILGLDPPISALGQKQAVPGGKLGNLVGGEIMIRAFFIVAFAALALLVASEGKTQKALTADILMGRWCGDVSAYTFTRDKLF